MWRTPSAPVDSQQFFDEMCIGHKISPARGKATVNKPMPKDTPGFVQPLTSVTIVLKTKSVVLRWERTVKVTMVEMKKTT